MSAYALDEFLNNVFDMYAMPNVMSDFKYTGTEYYQTNTESDITIEIPLPGMSKENLKINIEDGLLNIQATSSIKSRAIKNINKSWSLDDSIDINNINAKLENGLLTVKLIKTKPSKKTVAITVS